MTNKYQKHTATLLVMLAIIALPILADAQVEGIPAEPDAPIDGGLSLLVAAGVGYGAKKLKEYRKNK